MEVVNKLSESRTFKGKEKDDVPKVEQLLDVRTEALETNQTQKVFTIVCYLNKLHDHNDECADERLRSKMAAKLGMRYFGTKQAKAECVLK
jgi:hypothetical protein